MLKKFTHNGQIYYSVLFAPYDLEVKVTDRNQKIYVKFMLNFYLKVVKILFYIKVFIFPKSIKVTLNISPIF